MIFGVGLIKTGTTTFGDACELLGMSRLGWNTTERYTGHELMKLWDRGDIDKLVAIARQYDAMEDFPWALIYPELSTTFPDAKFVLTRRITPEKWLESAVKHKQGGPGYGMHAKVFGSLFPNDAPDLWLAKYEAHNQAVRSFFAGTDRLLEVCWEKGDGWLELCGFLGVPVPDAAFPHSNPVGSNSHERRPWVIRKAKKIRRRVRQTIGR